MENYDDMFVHYEEVKIDLSVLFTYNMNFYNNCKMKLKNPLGSKIVSPAVMIDGCLKAENVLLKC